MKKILISILLALSMIANCCCFIAFAAADFTEISIDIQYKADDVRLVVSGVTPAAYGQRIIVAAYNPANNEVTAELSNAKDPSAIAPLTTPAETKVFRFAEITAKKDGSFSGEWPLNGGVANGDYIIVKLSGTGKTPTGASKLFLFESSEAFQTDTLIPLESLTGDALGQFLVDKKLVLGLEKTDSYYLDNEFEEMFASVRDNDFEADTVTGRRFQGTEDVVTVLNRVEALQNLPAAPTAADIAGFISEFGHLLTYDFSEDNSDYTLMKTESHSLAAGIITQTPPICFTDVERIIEQAVGIAMLNSKDSTTIGPVVNKYAAILGINAADYETYCNTYTAYEVNKAFVERGFKQPSEVPAALSERIVILAAGGDSTSGSTDDGDDSGDGGGGGGGGGGGNPTRPVSKPTTDTSTEVKPVLKYTDLSHDHWAAEAVNALSSKNVINGFTDGTFRPDEAVTREQLVKMLVKAFALAGKSEVSFSDVAADRWSAAYIDAATACGIVQGVGEGSFAPEKAVSRQDAAVMLARLCDAKGIELSGSTAPTDSAIIAEYAQESVFRLAGAGVISGFEDGSFRPNEALTRAQSAKLIYGLLSR